MKILLAAAAVMALAGPAFAFDTDVQTIIEDARPKQLITADQLITLMRDSVTWCYKETDDGGCSWTETYLEVTTDSSRIEIANAYDSALDLYMVDEARFKQDRYSCEFDFNWVPSLRMIREADGVALSGRELDEYRINYANNFGADDPNCFDYQFVRADLERETVTLVQRTYSDFVWDADANVLVTLHFDEDDAASLHFLR